MKHSYFESIINMIAQIRMANSLKDSRHSNDNLKRPKKKKIQTDSDLKRFYKNNPQSKAVGINFADILASN